MTDEARARELLEQECHAAGVWLSVSGYLYKPAIRAIVAALRAPRAAAPDAATCMESLPVRPDAGDEDRVARVAITAVRGKDDTDPMLGRVVIATDKSKLLHSGPVGEPFTIKTGLDDGPWLPGKGPRKKAEPKSAAENADIRARAWATRRQRYGDRGHT